MAQRATKVVRFWRYTFLGILTGAFAWLGFHYYQLRTRKEALLKLAFVYPYSDDYFSNAQRAFTVFASWNNDGFFRDNGAYKPLVDAMTNLQKIQDTLMARVGEPNELLWEFEQSSIELYGSKADVTNHDIRLLERRAREYVEKFFPVLNIRRWKASSDEPIRLIEDSVLIDSKDLHTALDEFKKLFDRENFITIENTEFNLEALTRYELFVILEAIRWHRYKIEDQYIKLLETERRKWLNDVAHKFPVEYP